MVCTLQEVQAQFEARNARERAGRAMEARAMIALTEMYAAQRPHVKLPPLAEGGPYHQPGHVHE